MTDARNARAWLLFDGDCNFCRRCAARVAPLLHRRRFALAPLQTPWVESLLKPKAGPVWTEMLLLLPDGTTYGGTDAILELARAIWWARPLTWLAAMPGVKRVLRHGYAWVARHRHCLGGACRTGGRSVERPRRLAKWLPALTISALALGMRGVLPAWEWMWVMALALFIGAKWLTLWPLLGSGKRIPVGRWLAYALLWPGMDAVAFCTGPRVAKPATREWAAAAGNTLLGAALVWVGVPLVTTAHPLASGWVGMLGVVFLLHFGSFQLLALFWRALGIDARPIMRAPVLAPTLSAFWGGHWNRAFSDLMHRHVLAPLARRLGMRPAMAAVFLGSGLLHELLISLPANGGYGLPTLYFAVQGLGLVLERSRVGRRLGLGRGWRGRAFALTVAGGPAFWLFHPPFIHNVILPMLRSLGAF